MSSQGLLLEDVSMGVLLVISNLMISLCNDLPQSLDVFGVVLVPQLIGLLLEIAEDLVISDDAFLFVHEGILSSSLVTLVSLTISTENLFNVT